MARIICEELKRDQRVSQAFCEVKADLNVPSDSSTSFTGCEKIVVRNVCHFFTSANRKRTEALANVNLIVRDHEFVAIVGPSGCGKSTLLNIISGLGKPASGEVLFGGSTMSGISHRIGFISQSDTLLPWRTVVENVELGLEIKGIAKRERRAIARELINKTGLSGFEECYPAELSGGMKKRVVIIRSLAMDPEVLLMDEPFGALDVFTREALQDEILRIWQETRKTIVFVTHDLAEAITLADRVVLMTARPSGIKAEYDIPIPRPRSAFETHLDPLFFELQRLIWQDLKGEVMISPEVGQ